MNRTRITDEHLEAAASHILSELRAGRTVTVASNLRGTVMLAPADLAECLCEADEEAYAEFWAPNLIKFAEAA